MNLKNPFFQVLDAIYTYDVKRATKYISPTFVVSAHRKSYGNKIDRRAKTIEIALKVGKPNYEEREFIKRCKKAGEPFPIKKVQIKFFPETIKKAAKILKKKGKK